MSDREIILGVDTHKDIHVAAIVDQVGRLLCTSEFLASERGCRRMLAWARRYGAVRLAGVEGTGTTATDLPDSWRLPASRSVR